MCLQDSILAHNSDDSVKMRRHIKIRKKEKKNSKYRAKRVTGKEWVESLTEDLMKRPALEAKGAVGALGLGDGLSIRNNDSKASSKLPKKITDKVSKRIRNVLIHHPARSSQYDLPQNRQSSLSLHLSKEPRKGVSLGLLDRFRLMILKRRIIATRKNSAVAEIRHNPNGIPDFEELYYITDQHIAFQRRKLFDVLLDPEKRHLAVDSILDDYDILCPIKPSLHLKQVNRLRDPYRLCLVGRSVAGCSFETSDFMTRWSYPRNLQLKELDGIYLTRVKEETDNEELDLSKMGEYKYDDCLASKMVATRTLVLSSGEELQISDSIALEYPSTESIFEENDGTLKEQAFLNLAAGEHFYI